MAMQPQRNTFGDVTAVPMPQATITRFVIPRKINGKRYWVDVSARFDLEHLHRHRSTRKPAQTVIERAWLKGDDYELTRPRFGLAVQQMSCTATSSKLSLFGIKQSDSKRPYTTTLLKVSYYKSYTYFAWSLCLYSENHQNPYEGAKMIIVILDGRAFDVHQILEMLRDNRSHARLSPESQVALVLTTTLSTRIGKQSKQVWGTIIE